MNDRNERAVRLEKDRPMVVKTPAGTPVVEIVYSGKVVRVRQVNWRIPVVMGV